MEVFTGYISNLNDEQLLRATVLLSETEKHRLENMISVKRQREFIWGHYALRQILSQQKALPLQNIKIESLESGALWLPDFPHVYASLSHSHDTLAVAIASQSVGVDVEWVRPKDNLSELLAQIDSTEDAKELMDAGYSLQQAFFHLWTKREACYKLKSLCPEAAFQKPRYYYKKQEDFMLCVAVQNPDSVEWKNLLLQI